jgi:RNA polymerase sigma-32 factor
VADKKSPPRKTKTKPSAAKGEGEASRLSDEDLVEVDVEVDFEEADFEEADLSPSGRDSNLGDAGFADAVDAEIDEAEPADSDSGKTRPSNAKTAGADSAAAAAASTSLVTSDALTRYLAEVRQYPVLDREEEREIALRYVNDGDPDAAVQLVTANLRLVVMIAREYQRAFHNLLDLIQEGNVGLLEAVKQFDPYRGVRFPSYAVWWVRAYIIRYVMNNFRMVKVGTTQAQRRLFFNLRKEKAKLEALGFTPTPKLIADSLGVKEAEVLEMDQRLSGGAEVSGNAPVVSDDDRSSTVLDMLADKADTEAEVADGEFYAIMKDKLGEFAETLEGRNAEIFAERMLAEEPLTLRELGDRYGVSRERVRQMEAALKKRLREFLVEQVRDLDDDFEL